MEKKILITGMSGLIGGLLKDHLLNEGGYELKALNRSYVEGVENHQADISDLDAIKPAFDGQDVVVHLAAYLGSQGWQWQHDNNVLGTYNVFEAARLAGVQRVIFASSGSAIRGFERVKPYKDIADGNYGEVPKDFRMITRRVLKAFLQFQETNLFIRATFPIVGFPSCVAYFDRPDRVAGKTKYPLKYTLTHKKNCP